MTPPRTPTASLPRRADGANDGCRRDERSPSVGLLHIGPVELASPAIQAALSGYSDWPMRMTARRMGAAYTVAEVMLEQFVRQQKPGRQRTAHHLRVTADEHPVGGQLMGADPLQFAPAALKLVAAGFDVIDINFGCPVKSAIGGCRGGYHLSQPVVALKIVQHVRDAVPTEVPVTLKLRRGIDDTPKSRDRFFEILDGAFSLGVAAVTVHARTVEQKYQGPSRWDFLREVKTHCGSRTVIGSGDLFSAGDCLRMLHETGVDGVSIARGAIGNPWIFQQVAALLEGRPLPPPPTVRQQGEALREHFALAQECYGASQCVRQMKKFGIKYARLHPDLSGVRDAFVQARSPQEWWAVIDRWYADDRTGVYPDVDESQPAASE